MSDSFDATIDATPAPRDPLAPAVQPQPASVRPGPRAPIPASTDPDWWGRLHAEFSVAATLEAGDELARARHPAAQPGFHGVADRLRLMRAVCLDSIEERPTNAALELLRQIEGRLRGMRVEV